MKPEETRCQSCAMPLEKPESFGTNADGTRSSEYCSYCFRDGKFTDPAITVDRMIEKCVAIMTGRKIMPEAQARALMRGTIPSLKRWRKGNRWTADRAKDWYRAKPWLVGCNFIPSTAINQLEMWQAQTYDPATIDRELGWAEGIGFNSLRVFLHDLVWSEDPAGFAERIDHFLAIAERHGHSVILVLFDDCHRPDPALGVQPLPVPGVHNSGWKHSPGREILLRFHQGTATAAEEQRLRAYVQGVLTRFGKDERVLMWDVYNEPGQSRNGDKSHALLQLAWRWADEARPSQPLTVCLDGSVGEKNRELDAGNSDVITFHCYDGRKIEPTIARLQREFQERPVICTEYMARELGTTFQHSLPIFKRYRMGCYIWGLVAGKTQTHWNWKSVEKMEELRAQGAALKPGDPIPEPALWFHDVFRQDGTPFDQKEVDFVKAITARRDKT